MRVFLGLMRGAHQLRPNFNTNEKSSLRGFQAFQTYLTPKSGLGITSPLLGKHISVDKESFPITETVTTNREFWSKRMGGRN